MNEVTRRITASELLFDLDGTLIDSIAAVEAAWRTWADEESISMSGFGSFHGRTAGDIVAALVPPARVAAAVSRLSELEQRPTVPVVASPGAQQLIDRLPVERWSVVTSAAGPVARARLLATGLPLPTLLITADDVTRTKPDAEPFLAGRRWAAEEAPALAFEDTSTGLRAAKAAGCIAVGVVGTESADVLGEHADLLVSSLESVAVVSVSESIVLEITPIRA